MIMNSNVTWHSGASPQNPPRKFLVTEALRYQEFKQMFEAVSCSSCTCASTSNKQCSDCQVVLCGQCVQQKLIKQCLRCGSTNNFHQLDNLKLMTLNQMTFACKYNSKGCATSLNAESLPTHEITCPFQVSQSSSTTTPAASTSTSIFPSLQQTQQSIFFAPQTTTTTTSTSQAQFSPSPPVLFENKTQNSIQPTITNSIFQTPQALQREISFSDHGGNSNCVSSAEEYVPMSVFLRTVEELKNEIRILSQACAANFKGQCNNGHPLTYEARDSVVLSTVLCDVCKREPTSQQVGSYRCAACDFDRCEQCYNSHRLF